MRLEIAYISSRRGRLKSAPAQTLLEDYVKRSRRFLPVDTVAYETEPSLLAALSKSAQRTAPALILLDSRGENLTSEDFAARLQRLQDSGTQQTTFAIGPPDGWSPTALQQAGQRISFGTMTLPHELALVLIAEQLYRALTILAGHPYHSGHES